MTRRFLAFISILFLLSNYSYSSSMTVEEFLKEPDIRDVDVSPDGRHMAMVMNIDKGRYVVIRDLTKPDLPIIGTIGDDIMRPSSVKWVNNDRVLITVLVPFNAKRVRYKSEKDEDFDIRDHYQFRRYMTVDKYGKNLVTLMKQFYGKVWVGNFVKMTNRLINDDQHILMRGPARGEFALYKVNVETGKSKEIVNAGRLTESILTDSDGTPSYRVDYLPISRKLKLFEYVERKWVLLDQINLDPRDDDSVTKEDDPLPILQMSENNELYYIRRNDETGFNEVIARKRDGAERVVASHPEKDVKGLKVNEYSGMVTGYFLEGDLDRITFFDEKTQARYNKLSEKVGNYNFYFSPIFEDLVVVKIEGRDNPAGYYFYKHKESVFELIGDAYSKKTT